ncbi:uncharacterized protein LOC112539001 [Tetranychus urticae]|uniref:uncharacterized protein LOC112539001 n=1 Tax=Tetranychus urticae TaxID=32264 RepID=UPI000D65635B|nr:uncharacterized protein LOC112539001 [Tetranychus urticae]
MKNLQSITILCLIFGFIVSTVYSQPLGSSDSNPDTQDTKEASTSVNDKSSDQEGSSESDEDAPTPVAGPHRPPTINWGKCPQLEPKEAEKKQKADIIRTCLKSITLPENITQESVEKHRTEVAKCALNAENWFAEDGSLTFESCSLMCTSSLKLWSLTSIARTVSSRPIVIISPVHMLIYFLFSLSYYLQPQIVNQHSECRKEAEEQFPSGIAQIQLYQACMDYHISMICGIQIVGTGYSQ